MRAISMLRTRRTVIEATTSSRLSFSFTLLRTTAKPGSDMECPAASGLINRPALCFHDRPAGHDCSSRDRRQPEGEAGSFMNYTTDFKSVRHDVSLEEWQTRVDLAACYRLVDK